MISAEISTTVAFYSATNIWRDESQLEMSEHSQLEILTKLYSFLYEKVCSSIVTITCSLKTKAKNL